MPYLPNLDRRLELIRGAKPVEAGELNYAITKKVDAFLNVNGLNYQSINEAIGALECAKLELYRRIAAPYETRKLAENGDVFTCAPTE